VSRRRHYVYLLTRALPEGGCRYYIGIRTCPVGKTPETDTSYMGSGNAIKAAVKKHGRAAFSKSIVDVFETRTEAKALERALVGLATANSPWSYNLVEGGEDSGLKSEETKARMSEALRGREVSDETCARISRALHGRRLSREHVERVRQSKRGRRHTEEAKARMSNAHRPPVSGETKARMRASALRRVATTEGWAQLERLVGGGGGDWTPERREKLGAAHRGKKRSAKACRRMREAMRASWARRKAESAAANE